MNFSFLKFLIEIYWRKTDLTDIKSRIEFLWESEDKLSNQSKFKHKISLSIFSDELHVNTNLQMVVRHRSDAVPMASQKDVTSCHLILENDRKRTFQSDDNGSEGKLNFLLFFSLHSLRILQLFTLWVLQNHSRRKREN